MYNGTIGSISLGHYLGIPVRLHISFVLMAVFILFFMARGNLEAMGGYAILLLCVWFLCVLLHEAGHCLAVSRLGGTNDILVLTPFGGLSYHSYAQDPRRELIVAAAGPLMNLLGLLLASCILLAVHDASLRSLFDPFHPQDLFFTGHPLIIAVRMAVWINWGLLLISLLPATPFDGGWALRALLWPTLGDRQALIILRRVTLTSAVFLCLLAWWLGDSENLTVPAWLPLLVIAGYSCCFSVAPIDAFNAQQEIENLDCNFLTDYESPEGKQQTPHEEDPSLLRGWLVRRRQEQKKRTEEIEYDEECEVDDILQHVHESGVKSLTQRQRNLLKRVAARYRARASQ